MKYRSIVLSGPVASGTSTAGIALSKKLKLPYKSTGDFFRKYMLDNNIPLPNKEEIPDELDRKIDKEFTQMIKNHSGIIVDSLYAGYFTRNMPFVLKVLITANEKVRIKRAKVRIHTHKETASDVKKRDKAHDLKFRKLYADENFLNPKYFNLVIDNSNIEPKVVVEKIIEAFSKP